jgi:transcriptional regulator with XRE-family HTH domain
MMKRSHNNGSSKIPCYNPVKTGLEVRVMPFAEKLSKLRKDKGLTQEDLAKKVGVGIAQMRRYEKGASSPTLEVIKAMSKTLGVSADELIFDENEGVAPSRILDRKLLEQFELISRLNPHDKDAVQTIIESVIIKNKLQEVMPPMSDTVWTKEMKKVVSEFRKGAEEYSGEEIESIVDEAVTAVRGAENKRSKRVKVGA